MRIIKKFAAYSILGYSVVNPLNAANDVGICADSVVKNYPGKQRPDYYGNSSIDSFRCAMSGSTQLTPEQMKLRKDLIPDSHNFRLYGRVGLNAAAQQIRFKGGKTTQSSNQFDAAIGYRWKNTSAELEWLNLSSITYSNLQIKLGNPLIIGQVSGKIKGQAIFLGLNYELYKFYNYTPYLNLAIGLTSNDAILTLNAGPQQILSKYLLAGGLGLGVKFNIYSRCYADVIVRGLYLGQTKYNGSALQTGLTIKAKRIWLGASLRLIWLF